MTRRRQGPDPRPRGWLSLDNHGDRERADQPETIGVHGVAARRVRRCELIERSGGRSAHRAVRRRGTARRAHRTPGARPELVLALSSGWQWTWAVVGAYLAAGPDRAVLERQTPARSGPTRLPGPEARRPCRRVHCLHSSDRAASWRF